MSDSFLACIDLRSDTVTKPSVAMREVMARAEVGDDVYGEDSTVRALEETVATLLGKDRGLFVPSGTMGNQLALLGHCRPGDEVIVGTGAHMIWYESGAGAAFAGVQFVCAGHNGFFSPIDLEDSIKPCNYYYPRTRLVAFEDTHNRAGGRIWPVQKMYESVEYAKSKGLFTHLDGARLWNVCAATREEPKARAQWFDSVTVCLSKGLGAPVGSVLCGNEAFIEQARRHRKMLGAGMRQVGILAAAGLYALEHHRVRLIEDHLHAKLFALLVAAKQNRHIHIDMTSIETNMIKIDLSCNAKKVEMQARDLGLLIGAVQSMSVRVVTHLDVDRHAMEEAANRFVKAVELCCA